MEEKQNNDIFWLGIRCYTYNQSQYITDALNGFTMQQTTFPYIAMVVDDASTDGEQEVIAAYIEEHFDTQNSDIAYKKETDYAHITYAQHKTNKNCYIVVLYLKENHYQKKPKLPYLSQWRNNTKYEALCEGDDYWIDPLKLQKQVDFLENNPEYGMCYTNFNIYNQNTKHTEKDLFTTKPIKFPIKYNSAEEFVLKAGYVCPPSWVYRMGYMPSDMLQSCDGTFVMFTHLLCTTKVYGMTDTTVTYRILSESASHSSNYDKIYNRAKNLLDTQHKLIDKYNLNPNLKDICTEQHYKMCLTGFVIHKKKDDVKMANKIISNKSLKDSLLILLSKIPFGNVLLNIIYKLVKTNK